MATNGTRVSGPRCIALVGPFQSGKTTLLEAILARTGAIQRQGTADAGTTVGDASKEARDHRLSVELTVATTTFMDDVYTFVDCPGSVEFVHDMRAGLPAVDAAVVVCEMDEKKIPQLQLILRELEEQKIPRFLFLKKLDKADSTIHDALALLQPASRSNGVLRLMKALRHEAPNVEATARRLGVKAGNEVIAYVIKTLHTAHGGKMSIARVLNGQVGDSTTFVTPERDAGRVAGIFKLLGQNHDKRSAAQAGETVAFGKLDHANTGDTLTAGKQAHPALPKATPYPPVLAMAVSAKERKDDVKLG